MNMKINPPFEYITLQQLNLPGGRRYVSPDGEKIPSVTTILDKTADKQAIIDWREAIGSEKADSITNEAANLGSELHNNLENFMQGKSMSGSYMGKALAKLIATKGLSKVDEVWAIEGSFYYPGLYAGRSDLIGVHQGVPAIMDFKNARDVKTKDMIGDYFLQLCAYAMAHNWMYDTEINKGVIMMATRGARYLEFIIEGEEFDMYMDQWLSRLEMYYAMVNTEK